MKSITKTILAVLATGVISCALFSQQAQANTISIDDPPVVTGGGVDWTWTYSARTSNSFIDTTARVVIYDFAGYITGTAFTTAPGWVFLTYSAGTFGTPVPLGTGDNPAINNLVFAYTGPAGGGAIPDGPYFTFGAHSTFGLQVLGGYGTLDKGKGMGNPVSNASGPTRVPSAPDSGTTVGLLGLALAGIEGVRRMIHARKA